MRARAGRLVAAVTLTLVTLSGCADEGGSDALDQAREDASSALEDVDTELPDVDVPSVDVPDVNLPDVNWDEYEGDLQERIDELAANADCSELEAELEKVEVEGNSDVADYIEEQLKAANC